MSEFNLSNERKKLREDLNYLFSKINWGSSFLDAKAITIMNDFWENINETDKEFIRRLKELRWEDPEVDIYFEIDKLAGEKLIC